MYKHSMSRAWCKTIVTPYIKWGSYNSFAPSPRCALWDIIFDWIKMHVRVRFCSCLKNWYLASGVEILHHKWLWDITFHENSKPGICQVKKDTTWSQWRFTKPSWCPQPLILVQSNLSKPKPRRTAPIVRFSEVFGFPSVGFLVLCA